MSSNIQNYIFVDESGDPGKVYKSSPSGKKIITGASLFYILSAVCLDSEKLFLLEDKILGIKDKYGFRNEIKSNVIPLVLYKDLLKIINQLNIKIFYRLIDKKKYKGTFAVERNRKLHNIFDEYNLAKLISFAVKKCDMVGAEVVIDRADRRMLDGNFENFNNYLKRKTNTKTIERIKHVTHVDSKYVNVMQISDIVSGAIKDSFMKKNPSLKEIINKRLLNKVY